MDRVNIALLGAISLASVACGLFFLRFWRAGRDRFFLLFGISFLVEGINRFALALIPHPNEGTPGIYLVRLVSYALILAAIVDKNMERKP
jgi:uncharacterized membrane protein HdeD (DUF308 family)